jgi:endonuclease/exonuclease/phosphatase (EEP) superfamily protein YafD
MDALVVAAGIGAALVCVAAAIISILGLIGVRGGWPDVFNSFAPLQVAAALLGAGLARIWLGPGALSDGVLILGAVAAVAGLARIAPELARLRPSEHGEGELFRILLANVWNRNPTPGKAVAAILARDADAVILQEARGSLAPELPRLRVRYPFASQCPHSGLRVFSRAPILAQGCCCERAVSRRGRLLWATIAGPGDETVTLATTHLSHPYQSAQAAERKSLSMELGRLDLQGLVLAGDFNTTPWSEGMRRQDAMLAPLRRRTIGWFSWPARLGGLAWPLPVLPIDHLYAGPGWGLARLRRLRIPGSDHFATEATLVRRP